VGLWDWLRGKKADGESGNGAAKPADPLWLSSAESPFGVRTLDLRPVTQGMTSASTDPANATRAVSWVLATAQDIPPVDLGADTKTFRCALSYAIAPAFPDGLLFAPRVMEEKWALFHRGGSIIAVRSWTGQVVAVARGTRAGDRLSAARLAGPRERGAASSPCNCTPAVRLRCASRTSRLSWIRRLRPPPESSQACRIVVIF
jgi:hypothetical protein